MRLAAVLLFFAWFLSANSQTFIRKISSTYNGYSLSPSYIHQTKDSNYLAIMFQEIMGNTAPVYIRYDLNGNPYEIGALEAPLANGSGRFLFTKNDGLWYSIGGTGYNTMWLYDSSMSKVWRKDYDSGTLYPYGEQLGEAIEVDGKLMGVGIDSVGSILLSVDLKTGNTLKTASLLNNCIPCVKTAYSGELSIIGNRLHFGTRDEISHPYSSWKMYSGSADTSFGNFKFTSIDHLTYSGNAYNVWPYHHNNNSNIVFEDTIKSSGKLYTLYDSTFTKSQNTPFFSNLEIEGVLVGPYTRFQRENGVSFYHYIIDRGKGQNPRNVDVIYKIGKNGNLLREYILEYVQNGEVKSEFWIRDLKPTIQGGFAFYTYNQGVGPKYILVVTDSNLNVNGKPFYSDFIANDTLSVLSQQEGTLLSIFPNPTSNQINIVFKENRESEIHVIDAQGRSIITLSSTTSNNVIDLTSYPNGLYFISVNSNNSVKTFKVVKQ